MKKNYKLLIGLLLVCIYTSIHAQNFQVIDVNKSSDSRPENGAFNRFYDAAYSKFEYAVLNGVSYFAADDGIHGAELWKSDGTASGTKMVKDIFPGLYGSDIHDITVSGDKVFFAASDGEHGLELWVTNGENSGTRMVKDIYKGSNSSSPAYLVDGDGELYFFTNRAATGDELWKSDGTKEGTVRIASFYTSQFNFSQYGNQLTYVNGHLFFAMNAGSSSYVYGPQQLWVSDGTTAGTYLLKQISYYYTYLLSLTALNGLVYFSAVDDSGTRGLWVSDGTFDGTHAVNNANNIHLNEDAFNSQFNKLLIKDNKLFFSGYDGDNDGAKLCSYDPSDPSNNVEVVKDFNPGSYSYNLYNFTNVNDNFFFTVFTGQDQTLWKSDGTADGTMQVKDINPGGGNVYYYRDFKNANGTLLFTFYDDKNGIELWKSDGTEAGTVMVKDIFKGLYSSDDGNGGNITYIGNNISLFRANNNGTSGLELWRTDNTKEGTSLVKDINKSATGSSYPSWLTLSPDSSKLFFAATDEQYGNELRITDGTDEHTELVQDLYPGFISSNPQYIASTTDATYFWAGIKDTLRTGTSDLFSLFRMFKTDGTPQGTSLIPTPSLDSLNGYLETAIGAGNIYYIVLYNYNTGNQELWRSDGTADGTYALKTDIYGGYFANLTAVGNTVYFTNYNIFNGTFELWKTDGTTNNTNTITPYNNSGFINLYNLYSFNDKVFFNAADNVTYATSIWSSDGTTKQTKPSTQYITATNWLGAVKGRLYFSGFDQLNFIVGEELYWTNGNKSVLAADINPQPYVNSSPHYGLVIDSTLYFVAYDSYGASLYKTKGNNGVVALTTSYSSNPYNLVNANHNLYFVNNGILWQSDGTPKGTYASNPNANQYLNINSLSVVKDRLCIIGYSQQYGQELYSLKVSAAPNAQTAEAAMAAPVNAFTARLLNNPFTDQLKFTITIKDQQSAQITIADAAGRMIISENKVLSAGINNLSYNASAWMPGMYLVKITTANGSSLLKAVK